MELQQKQKQGILLGITLFLPLLAFRFSKSYGEDIFYLYSLGIFLLVALGLYVLEVENILTRTVVHILLTTSIEKYALYDMVELSAKKIHSLQAEIIIYQIVLSLVWGILSYRKNYKDQKIDLMKELVEGVFIIFPLILLRRDGGMTYFYILMLLGNIWLYKSKQKIPKEKKIMSTLALLSLLMIALSIYFGEKTVHTKEHFLQYVQYILVFICLNVGFVSKKNWLEVKKIFWISCLLPISLAAVQILGNHFAIGRMCNVYNISSYSFLVLAMAMISLYLFIFEKDWKFLFLIPILYGMILYSGTRMIWIVTVVMTFGVLLASLQWKVYLMVFLVAVGGYSAYQILPQENAIKQRIESIAQYKKMSSSAIRLLMWKEAYEQFLEKPVLGHGYTSYMQVSAKRHTLESLNQNDENYIDQVCAYNSPAIPDFFQLYHPHSNFFELLSGTGLLGTLCFYLFQGYFFFLCMLHRWEKEKRVYCDIGILILGAYHLYSITDVTLFMEKASMVLVVMEALLLGGIVSDTTEKRER